MVEISRSQSYENPNDFNCKDVRRPNMKGKPANLGLQMMTARMKSWKHLSFHIPNYKKLFFLNQVEAIQITPNDLNDKSNELHIVWSEYDSNKGVQVVLKLKLIQQTNATIVQILFNIAIQWITHSFHLNSQSKTRIFKRIKNSRWVPKNILYLLGISGKLCTKRIPE